MPRSDVVSDARRSLVLYAGLVIASSALVQVAIARTGQPIEALPLHVLALMWSPGLASIVCRLVLRQGFGDISFSMRARSALKPLAYAWLYPIAVGFIAYGGAWLTGLASFEAAALRIPIGAWNPPAWLTFIIRFGLTATLGTLFSAISAAGEEIGWRGYMLTRLVDAGVRRPVLVSGIVWGAWHLPLIVTGQYAAGPYPLLSAPVFLVSIVAAGYVHAWVRLRSGSVWPAVAAHGAWNAIIQGVFDTHTAGGGASRTTSIWVGESGLAVALVSCVVAALMVRGDWWLLRHPDAPPLSLARP